MKNKKIYILAPIKHSENAAFHIWPVRSIPVTGSIFGGKNKVTCSLILDQQHSTGKKKINDPVTVTQELKYDVPNMLMKFTKTKPKNI